VTIERFNSLEKILQALLEAISRFIHQMNNCHIRLNHAKERKKKASFMGTLLQDHLRAVEITLLAQSRISANAGHPQHKGTPRENFLKIFLVNHLSERVEIGQGEIIDARTQASEPRHQNDIIIYRRNFPRIAFDHTIFGYLAESVVATIEVKSALTKDELVKAVRAAHDIKQLERLDHNLIRAGYQPPSILSYVVAYDGPASMETVNGWLNPMHQELSLSYPMISSENRLTTPSPSLDGIFVLGKGFVLFANSPFTFPEVEQIFQQGANVHWYFADTESDNLMLLFLLLTNATSNIAETYLDPYAYLAQAHLELNKRGVNIGMKHPLL